MEAFAAWALEQGVLCEAAEMTQSETEGLGLVARTQLPEDAAVVTVPLGATLHVQRQRRPTRSSRPTRAAILKGHAPAERHRALNASATSR